MAVACARTRIVRGIVCTHVGAVFCDCLRRREAVCVICVRWRSRSRSCAHLATRSVAACAAWQHVHCTHTSVRHRVHVSDATCDVIGADDSANTVRWLVKLAFDRLDLALENRFARHFLRVCSTSLAAQRDVCDEWQMSIERETRATVIGRQQVT